jgi:hypothetical protein
MKNSIIILSASILLMFASGCDLQKEETLAAPDAALMAEQALDKELHLKSDANKKVRMNKSNVFNFETGEMVSGAFSKLLRMDDGLSAVIHSSGLEAEGVYTVWMVVFENPEFCSDNTCGEDDIFDGTGNLLINPDGTFGTPGVNVSVFWADGKVASAAGVGTFTFKIKENNSPGAVLFGPGLTDAEGSEIHFVLRNHGQAIPGLLEEQLTTFEGGCEVNQCEDEQFAVHLAEL